MEWNEKWGEKRCGWGSRNVHNMFENLKKEKNARVTEGKLSVNNKFYVIKMTH
jgi:hypothetical protein